MSAPELLSDDGFRLDGRRPREIRSLRMRLGLFPRADGSAYIEQGNTKVVALVYGPREVRGPRSRSAPDQAVLRCRFSLAPFSGPERRRPRGGEGRGSDLALRLQQSLEAAVLTHLYPRSQIDVYVQVLQSDGSHCCTGTTAAALAVLDAGIPLRDVVCAGSAALAEGTALTDPNGAEEAAVGPGLALALLPASGLLALVQLSARVPCERLEPVMEAAADGCRELHRALDRELRRSLRERHGEV
ncbi:exosome complex component RRP41 [Melopsittacus undulatus]|uniref:exosome complex component RRP41 n=1 Tax=Melopsittacus undulatus TaxID=13146 RepID=UPI00146B6B3D|nr:exosome complex component RRP41 [Melopsittacus undulatus]